MKDREKSKYGDRSSVTNSEQGNQAEPNWGFSYVFLCTWFLLQGVQITCMSISEDSLSCCTAGTNDVLMKISKVAGI